MPRSSSSRHAPPEVPARAPESAGASSSSSSSVARFIRQRKGAEPAVLLESSAEAAAPDSDRRPARLARQVADASVLDEPLRAPRRGTGPQRQAYDGVHVLAGPFNGAAVKRRPPKTESHAVGSAREAGRLAVLRQRAPSPDGATHESHKPPARHAEEHAQSKASHGKGSAAAQPSQAALTRPLRDHKKKHRHASVQSSSTSTCTTSTTGMHKTKAVHTASATAHMTSDDSNSGPQAKGTSFNAAPGWGDLPGASHADRSAGWELRPHTSEGLAITVCLLVLLGLVIISLWAFMTRRWKRQRAADRCSKVHLHSRHSDIGSAVSGSSLRKGTSKANADGFLHAPKQALRRLASAARGGTSSRSQQASFSRLESPSLAHSPFRLCVPADQHAAAPSSAPLGALGTVMRTAFGLIEQYPTAVSHVASPAPSPSLTPLDCAYAGSPNMSKALAKGWGADGASPHGLTSAAGGAGHGLLPGRRPSTKRRSPFDLADSPILAPSAAFGSPRRGYTHTLAPGASFAALSPDVERKGMVHPNSPRRPSLLRFDSGGTTLVPSEWAGSHASLELDAGMIGLGIGMDHALENKGEAPLVEHHSTQPCSEVLPSKAVMLVADVRAAHERSLSSSRAEHADATSTSTKTLCAETLELGLLWQPLPGEGALRDGGPMELRVNADMSAESSFEAVNLSSEAFAFGLSEDKPDTSVASAVSASFGGNEYAEPPLHDLVAISASSSERSFTVYESGTHLPSRVARALTEAGLTSAEERNASLDAARSASAASARDESVVFAGIHDAEHYPPSQAWLGRESFFSEPLDMLSMREEAEFTPACTTTLQHMQNALALERPTPATGTSRPRAQTVATVRPDLGPTVERQRRQRALSSPRLGRLRNMVQSVDQRDDSRLVRLSRVAHSGAATSRQSSSRTSRGSLGVRPFRTTPRANRIAQGIAATARVALVCASSSPADESRVSNESQYSRPSLYVSPVKLAAALNKPLPDTPLPVLQAVRLDAAPEDARDALLAFFATNENFYATRGDSPVSDDASTVVATPSPDRAERALSLGSVSSEQTPKALLIDTAPTTFRLPARAPTLDFHLPLRIHPASSVEAQGASESWPGVADSSSAKAVLDDSASLLSMEEFAAYVGGDLDFESTPPRAAPENALGPVSTGMSEDEAPLCRTASTREPVEVLDKALALLRSRERFVPQPRQADRPSSPRSMTSSDSGLSNGPQLLFKSEASAVGSTPAASSRAEVAAPADVRTWSDEEAELERERNCHSPIWMQRALPSSLRIDPELERLRSRSSPGTPTGRRSKPQSAHASQEGTPRHHRTATLQIESRSPARKSPATSSGSPRMRPLMLPARRRASSLLSNATTLPASRSSSPLSEVSTPKLPRAIDRTATLRLAAQAPVAPVETPTRRPLAAAQLIERSVLTEERTSRTSKRGLRSSATSSARHSRSASATPRSCPMSSAAPEAKACASPGSAAPRPRRPPMVRARSSTVSGIPTLSQAKLLHAASSPPLLSKSISERARLRARESDYASPTMQVFRFYDSRRSVAAAEDAQPRDVPTDDE